MAGISITRMELTADELRLAASKAKNAHAARRMLALALVLEGVDRESAANICGMDRQTLRDWVHRYNAQGLEGLLNRRGKGRVRWLERVAALLHKSADGRIFAIPGQTYRMTFVTGMPRAVKPFGMATRTWNSAT